MVYTMLFDYTQQCDVRKICEFVKENGYYVGLLVKVQDVVKYCFGKQNAM